MKPEEKKEQSDHAFMTFARANPPHSGHIRLFKNLKKAAESAGGDHHVFLSQSNDKTRNPLTHSQKVAAIHKMAPGINVHPSTDGHDMFTALGHLHKKGYKKVTVMVGEDRKEHFENLIHKYNGDKYNFEKIHVVKNPNALKTRATQMREYAKSGNFKEFAKHYPKEIAKDVYMQTRKGLKTESALFILGGPGSGKDILVRETAISDVQEIGLARIYDACIHQKNINEVDGRPLVINGNADDADKVLLVKKVLEALDYKTAMIFVSVKDAVSKSLNESRDRPMNETIRSKKHADSMRNLQLFKEQFSSWHIFHNEFAADRTSTEGFAALFFTGNLLDEEVKQFLDESWGHKVSSFKKFKEHAEEHAFTNANIGGIKFHTREVGHHIGGNVKPWHQTSAILTYHHNQTQPYIIGTFNHHGPGASEEGHGQTLGYGKSMSEGTDRSEFGAHRALQDAAKERMQKQQQRTHAGSSYFDHVHDSQVGKHSTLAKKDKSPPIKRVPSPSNGSSTMREDAVDESLSTNEPFRQELRDHVRAFHAKGKPSSQFHIEYKGLNRETSLHHYAVRDKNGGKRYHAAVEANGKGVHVGEVNEGTSMVKGFSKFRSKGTGKKSIDPPMQRFDSRVSDGMAMSATLAAEEFKVGDQVHHTGKERTGTVLGVEKHGDEQMVHVKHNDDGTTDYHLSSSLRHESVLTSEADEDSMLHLHSHGAGKAREDFLSKHDPNTCRACRHLRQGRKGMTFGELEAHAKKYPNLHSSYRTNIKGNKIREEEQVDEANYSTGGARKLVMLPGRKKKVPPYREPEWFPPSVTLAGQKQTRDDKRWLRKNRTLTHGKSIKEFREIPRSPDALMEPARVYEDWGAEIREVAGVKVNAPFRTSTGYSVIVEGEGELKTIEFEKKTGTPADWSQNNG